MISSCTGSGGRPAKTSPPEAGEILACPTCKGGLSTTVGIVITCTACGLQFPQRNADYLDLLSDRRDQGHENLWYERQQKMEEWYRSLISDPAQTIDMLSYDYEPFAPFLMTLAGIVLDLGGGPGFTRKFLAPTVAA